MRVTNEYEKEDRLTNGPDVIRITMQVVSTLTADGQDAYITPYTGQVRLTQCDEDGMPQSETIVGEFFLEHVDFMQSPLPPLETLDCSAELFAAAPMFSIATQEYSDVVHHAFDDVPSTPIGIAFIHSIAVRPEFRGKGYGALIYTYIARHFELRAEFMVGELYRPTHFTGPHCVTDAQYGLSERGWNSTPIEHLRRYHEFDLGFRVIDEGGRLLTYQHTGYILQPRVVDDSNVVMFRRR